MTLDLTAYDDSNTDLRAHMAWEHRSILSTFDQEIEPGPEPVLRPVPRKQLMALTSSPSQLRKASLLTAVCRRGCTLANIVRAGGLLCIITRDRAKEGYHPIAGEPDLHGQTRLEFHRFDAYPETWGTTVFWTACVHRRAVVSAEWIATATPGTSRRLVVPDQAPTVQVNGATKPAELFNRFESASHAYGKPVCVVPVDDPDGTWLFWCGSSFAGTIA